MRRLVVIGWLTVLWIVLWRDVSVANVLSGLVVSVAVSAGLSLPWAGGGRSRHRVRLVAASRFLVYFAWKLLEANVVIAREVVTPRNRIQTGIIAVTLPVCSDQVVTLVANAVSLTPGTLTLEVRGSQPCTLYVHVLHLHDVERAREDVRTLARLAVAAFEWSPDTHDVEVAS